MNYRPTIVLLVLSSGLFSGAAAQGVPDPYQSNRDLLDFTFVPESTFEFLSISTSGVGPGGRGISNSATFFFTITDTSVDSGSLNPAGPQNSAVNYHSFEFDIDWVGGAPPSSGWRLAPAPPTIALSLRGQSFTGSITIQTEPSNTVRQAAVQIVATMYHYNEPQIRISKTENFTAIIYPSPALQMQVIYGPGGAPLNAPPDTWITIPVDITNADLYPQPINVRMEFAADPLIDPGKIPVAGNGPYLLEPLQTIRVNLSLLTPKETTWYRAVPLVYTITAQSAQQESVSFRTDSVVAIDGFYISTTIWVLIPILLLLLVILILILLIGKRFYDERILGKPIPPWRIPEEAAALETLRKNDPRQFYITRYFLMVEEYESALNWFYGYKRRTKKALRREAKASQLMDRATALKTPKTEKFDRRAERIKRLMRRKQERRRLQLEANLSRLQEKLAKHYEEDFEKDHTNWEKKVEKLKAKANKPWAKARKKWEREVERTMEAWEKPFAKEKAKREKEIAKAKDKYAAQVKKQDKETWREWHEAVQANEKENRIREKEGRDPLPEPALVSEVVGPPNLPKPFKEPPKPTLPPEPDEPVVKGLPPEPKLAMPKLEESHYARKARRARKKTDRKVRRLERKTDRMLAKNERDRVKAMGKAAKKRDKLLRRSHRVTQPTLIERLFRNTPEHRERRAHKTLLKALAKERVKTIEQSEGARLEVLQVEAQRQEAEALARLIRQQAEVRKSGGSAAMRAESAPELVSLKQQNREKLLREQEMAKERVRAERQRAVADLEEQLREELVKERAERERIQQQKQAAMVARAEKKAPRKEAEVDPTDEIEAKPEAATMAAKSAGATKPKRAKK